MSVVTVEPGESQAADDRPGRRIINVGDTERTLSALAGAGLITSQLLRGRLFSIATVAGAALVYRGMSGHCALYQALGITHPGGVSDAIGVKAKHGIRFDRSVTIQKPIEIVYSFWRDFENYPRVIEHLVSVTPIGNQQTRWLVNGPFGQTVEWTAETIEEQPHKYFSWRSIPGSDLDTAGSAHFEELSHGRGTAVRWELKYDPPAGRVGAAIAQWLGQGVDRELYQGMLRMKSQIEASEFPTISNQPRGNCSAASF